MKHSVRRFCSLYRRCIRTAFSAAAAYRFNFIAGLVITFLGNILFTLVTLLIYGAGASFPGWDMYQVLLIQSIFTISTGISELFFQGIFWETTNAVKEGTFEVILLKPLNPLVYMAAVAINPQAIAFVAGGSIMFGISAVHVSGITLLSVLNCALFVAAGLSVLLGMTLIMSAVSFKWVGNSRIPEIFDSIEQFAKYPATMLPQAVRSVVVFVIPVAVIAFVPAQALQNTLSPYYYWCLIPCALFALAGFALYHCMIKNYESAGG